LGGDSLWFQGSGFTGISTSIEELKFRPVLSEIVRDVVTPETGTIMVFCHDQRLFQKRRYALRAVICARTYKVMHI